MAITYTHGVSQEGRTRRRVRRCLARIRRVVPRQRRRRLWAKLQRDSDEARPFVSIAQGASVHAVEDWRQLDGMGERIGRIRELLVDFTPANARVVEVGKSVSRFRQPVA